MFSVMRGPEGGQGRAPTRLCVSRQRPENGSRLER